MGWVDCQIPLPAIESLWGVLGLGLCRCGRRVANGLEVSVASSMSGCFLAVLIDRFAMGFLLLWGWVQRDPSPIALANILL